MAAIDDALNEASIRYGPHQIFAYWRESDRLADGALNADTPVNLTTQSDGKMTISHAMDDGLPDPVTMTGSGDPSGVMSVGLNGREGLTLASSGYRPFDAGGGSWDSAAAATTITSPIPTGIIRDDLIVAAILVDDNTAAIAQIVNDPKDLWDFHGVVTDAPLAMYVYSKRRWKTAHPQLTLLSDKPVDYMSTSIAFWARNPTDMSMDYRITNVGLTAEAASTTTHTVTSQLSDRGYQLGFWGSAAVGGITPGAGLTLNGDPALNGLVLMSAVTALRDTGIYTLSATQSPANAIMCMAALSVEPYARPRMDARKYFSSFNHDSPVFGWDRDTADVISNLRVLTPTGAVDTRVFTGQMQGIKITGRAAEMTAVSKARIRLNRSITLPIVTANRENMTVDWLATYLMARGGSFVGPAPNKYTRYWAPLYGSTHAHWDTPQSYNSGYMRDSINPFLLFGLRPPQVVAEGRWLSAMYGQQTATRIEEVSLVPRRMYEMTRDDFPHLYDDQQSGPLMADMMSLANNKGRLQFWVRGDAAQSAPSYVTAGDDYLVKMNFFVTRASSLGGGVIGAVEVGVASNSRNGYIRMGNDAAGYTSVSFVMPSPLPTDGLWHFYGFYWDFAAGFGNVCADGTVIVASTWATNGNNDTTDLPLTDEVGRGRSDNTSLAIKSHLPISDVILDFGEPYAPGQWSSHYPTPQAPGANATMRATNQALSAIAVPTAVNAWDTLSGLARATMSALRCDEQDIICFMPLTYFGETAQMTPVAVQDTRKNISDLDVDIDPSKIRNVVTLKFSDTRVDTKPQPVLQYLTSTAIPKGVSSITFPMDVLAVEIHGQASQSGVDWAIANLTSSQIITPTLPKTNHYITANTSAEGTGTVLTSSSVSATITSWDAGSITLRFNNSTGAIAYLANNGDQVPFLQIIGYGARESEAYTTVRDEGSVMVRRERALDAEMEWIHTRGVANEVAAQMVNLLSQPRAELIIRVMGDPRRKPGDLVTVLDDEGTKVLGTWRVLVVEHHIDGPQYTQDLKLVQVGPIMNWDDSSTPWGSSVWGE